MMDPCVRAALLQRCSKIVTYVPNSDNSLFRKYVPLIDTETTLELTKIITVTPGLLGVASDAVKVNHKRKTLYTMSNSELSMFWT